jgi:hypothetical protein
MRAWKTRKIEQLGFVVIRLRNAQLTMLTWTSAHWRRSAFSMECFGVFRCQGSFESGFAFG